MSILILLLSAISCKPPKATKSTDNAPPVQEGKALQGLRFEIFAAKENRPEGTTDDGETLDILATLFNDNADTLYFLSSSCDGDQYMLRFDTTQCSLKPAFICNASFPLVQKIPPKGKHTFSTRFTLKTKVPEIAPGFDLYRVNRNFDMSGITLSQLQRPVKSQTILWAKATSIQER